MQEASGVLLLASLPSIWRCFRVASHLAANEDRVLVGDRRVADLVRAPRKVFDERGDPANQHHGSVMLDLQRSVERGQVGSRAEVLRRLAHLAEDKQRSRRLGIHVRFAREPMDRGDDRGRR